MSYRRDFVGHIEITPGLSVQEQDYLRAFAGSRRHRRPGGPYALPEHVAGADLITADLAAHGVPGEGQPGLWCPWVPSCAGGCLAHAGDEESPASAQWLAYLIDHFLRPGAHAEAAGRVEFMGFTFDHFCAGVVARDPDSASPVLIRVRDNMVTEERPIEAHPTAPRPLTLVYPATVIPFRRVTDKRHR